MTQTILHTDELEGWRGEIHDGEVVSEGEEQDEAAEQREAPEQGEEQQPAAREGPSRETTQELAEHEAAEHRINEVPAPRGAGIRRSRAETARRSGRERD